MSINKYLKNISNVPRAMLCGAALFSVSPVLAADVSLSGFGTIGYAKSDQSFDYLRHISKSGTFITDSVFGAQMDASFTTEWNATVQAKLAPALGIDNRFEPTISWAFLSYRPNNDWLIRAGKLRMPFYLNAENLDVGVTYDAARLPTELYSFSPTMDFNGASFVKSWDFDDTELNLDGYWGRTTTPWRIYHRDAATPDFVDINIEARGLLLSLNRNEDIYRAGFHNGDLTLKNGGAFTPDLIPVTMNPLSGISGTYYVPSTERVFKLATPAYNIGMDVGLGHDFRAVAEYVRRMIKGVGTGPDTESYYLSLLKKVDNWTPYLSYARIKSRNLAVYQSINDARVTSTGAPQSVIDGINATQRNGADNMTMFDQHSWAIGTSYALDPKSKIKAEWLIVDTGAVSSFVDAPAGEDSGGRHINVFSLSYSFVF